MTVNNDSLDSQSDTQSGEGGGFVALAIVAAAVGAGAALLLAPDRGVRRTRSRSRSDQRLVAAAGFLVGAGLTALLTPESGPATRKVLSGTLSRIKVGAIDRIERLRLSKAPRVSEDPSVRSVQELGRDPNNVF